MERVWWAAEDGRHARGLRLARLARLPTPLTLDSSNEKSRAAPVSRPERSRCLALRTRGSPPRSGAAVFGPGVLVMLLGPSRFACMPALARTRHMLTLCISLASRSRRASSSPPSPPSPPTQLVPLPCKHTCKPPSHSRHLAARAAAVHNHATAAAAAIVVAAAVGLPSRRPCSVRRELEP
jgi:hypothetical protein